ncbi:MAG TPA: hypothetical protein VF526_07455 [Solirubrobacteraceae bacterium]
MRGGALAIEVGRVGGRRQAPLAYTTILMASALDPRREAADEHVACLVGDFLDSLISPRTRSL